jgi:hypothetical protein
MGGLHGISSLAVVFVLRLTPPAEGGILIHISMNMKEAEMPVTRRTQILMDPDEFRRLRALAERRKSSVGELIRAAVREAYLAPQPERQPIVDAILQMRLPKMNWKKLKKEIEAGHAGLS